MRDGLYLKKFLLESNAVEGVYGEDRLLDALDAWYWLANREINKANILQAHSWLMKQDRAELGSWNIGAWRTQNVRVGSYIAPDAIHVPELMDKWIEKYWYVPCDWKQAHIDFESIHPFLDGNGRIGRIIMNVHRLRMGLQLFIVEANYRQHYYLWFKKDRLKKSYEIPTTS